LQYTYLIVHSDASSSLQLKNYLKEFTELAFSGRFYTALDAINAALKLQPDVVFINLDDEDFSAFEIITELQKNAEEIPQIIAISHTKNQAYDAMKHHCFDYWLMPLSELEMRKTVLRLKRCIYGKNSPKTICLKSYRDFHYVDTDNILYLKAANNATDVFMADGSTVNAYRSLKKFEQQLPDNFLRVHQSYMLNTKHVARINYGKAICSLRGQNLQLPFSKTYKENVDSLKRRLTKNSIRSFE